MSPEEIEAIKAELHNDVDHALKQYVATLAFRAKVMADKMLKAGVEPEIVLTTTYNAATDAIADIPPIVHKAIIATLSKKTQP